MKIVEKYRFLWYNEKKVHETTPTIVEGLCKSD